MIGENILSIVFKEKDMPKELSIFAAITALSFSLFHICTGIYGELYPQLQRSIHLFFALILAYTLHSYSKRARKFAKVERLILLPLLIIIGSLFFMHITPQRILERGIIGASSLEVTLGIILIILVLEATRRVLGLALTITAIIFLSYVFLGPYIPFLYHKGYDIKMLIEYQVWTLEGMFSIPLGVSASYVALFIVFGALLEEFGISNLFMDLANAILHRKRGVNPAEVAIVSNALLGMVSGAATTGVVTVGPLTLPSMIEVGYRPAYAAGVLAASATAAQITPPVMGAAAFIMAEFLGVPYWRIALAFVLPSVLYYIGALVMVRLEALKIGVRSVKVREVKLTKTILSNIHGFISIFILLYYLFIVQASPTTAAVNAILALLTTGTIYSIIWKRRIPYREILRGLIKGGINIVTIALATATAGIIIGVTSLTGLGIRISRLIVLYAINASLAALIIAIVCIILGMAVPTSAAYIMTVIFAAPALSSLGIEPFVTHAFVLYWAALSMITPPVALASYVAAGLAKANFIETSLNAIKLALVTFIVPFIFLFDPSLLLMGTLLQTAFSFTKGLIATVGLAISLEGYFEKHLNTIERVLLFLSSMAIFVPLNILVNVIGLLITISIVLLLRFKK